MGEGTNMDEVDLEVPRPCRLITFGHNGLVLRDVPVTGDEMMAPRQLADGALRADRAARVKVVDLVTGELLVDLRDEAA